MEKLTEQIIEKASAGDVSAFEVLYEKTSQLVFNSSLRIVGNSHDAQEVTQDVYVKVFRKLKTYKVGTSFYSWIYRIAYNESINFVNKRNKRKRTRNDEAILECQSQGPEVIEKANHDHHATIVSLLLDALSSEYRQCLELRELHGFQYQEIAEILKININTVRTRLKRARMQLVEVGRRVKKVVHYEV